MTGQPIAIVDGQDLRLLLDHLQAIVDSNEHIRVMKFQVDTAGVHIKVNHDWSRPYGLAPRD